MLTRGQLLFTVFSFVFFTALVALATKRIVGKGDKDDTVNGYFLAGSGLSGVFIAGSMVLTNLSAENIVGLSGQGYTSNMSGMAWETTAVVSTIITAFILLPIYLRRGYTTLPEMLQERFGEGVRRTVAILFLLGYLIIGVPVCLYAGAIAFNQIFNISELLGITWFAANAIIIISVGIIGALYSIFGGLKAVTVSDTINGVLLAIAVVLVPIFALLQIGDGNMITALHTVVTNDPAKLSSIGSPTDPVPFATLFTGMILANMFYWGTNQSIIQRSMGAKSLEEGQKGILFSGILKLLFPLLLIVPGILMFTIDPTLEAGDLAYPTLVATVLPIPLLGLFCAALFGSIISTYNSFINSSATIFMLDIYVPTLKQEISEEEIVRRAKHWQVAFAAFAICIAPFMSMIGDGLYNFARSFTGYYNIPVLTVVVCGLFIKRSNSLGAQLAVLWHVLFYFGYKFWFAASGIPFLVKISEINYIHIYAISFIIMLIIVMLASNKNPKEYVWKEIEPKEGFDMTPWRSGKYFATCSASLLVYLYLIFSPLGFADPEGSHTIFINFITIFVIIECIAMYLLAKKQNNVKNIN